MTITSNIPDSGSTLWIKSMTVETQDENHDAISSEFLCHAWLTFKSAETKEHGMLSVSQGTETVTFPDGYAFPVPVTDDYKVVLTGMAENSNYPTIDQKMVLKYSISYYTDEEANKYKIKTLETFNLVARPEADAAHPRKHEVKPGLKSHHWLVPPGRHTYKAPAFRALFETADNPLGIGENARMHFIRIHLHGYGESVGLFDKTTGEEVWKGYAKNHKTLRHLLDVDSYSDSEGIALHPDHEYELEVVYDNPTEEPVDAMGALRVFIAEK